MVTYTVAFLRKGYIAEMNEKEFKKVKLSKDVILLNFTSINIINNQHAKNNTTTRER